MISRYRIAGAIKTKLALLGVVIACIAGVWAPTASATTTSAATSSSCTAGATGYWTGYWTWNANTQSWSWTWVWDNCTGGWTVS